MGLFSEYGNVIYLWLIGFAFLAAGLYILQRISIPGGLLFCGSGLFCFFAGWYELKRRGTDDYGKTITFRWEDLPAWKRWVIFLAIGLFILLFLWVVLTVPSSGPGWTDWSQVCIGECT